MSKVGEHFRERDEMYNDPNGYGVTDEIEVFCCGDKCGKKCDEGFQHGYLEYHQWARKDAYGLYTGLYCDDCFKNNYPYRTDRYHDPMDCGERLDPDDSLPWEY